jgi:nicotinamidase-related amidase
MPSSTPTVPTALLLIDVQDSFRRRPYWSENDLPAFLDRCQALIDGARAAGWPIVRVLHSDGPDVADNPFAIASGLVRPLDGLRPFDADLTVVKHRHSALVGTGLPVWLHRQGIRRLVVAGIRTEQCCETTARHASDEGWAVDFALDATLSFDMPLAGGRVLTAAQIRERTAVVLEGRFARVATVDALLADARQPAAGTRATAAA